MSTRMSCLGIGLLAIIWCGGPRVGGAALIASWNFNDGDLLVDAGSGTLVSNFTLNDQLFFSGTTINGLPGVTAGQALGLRDRANNGRYLQFAIDTSGYQAIEMSFAWQRSATGFQSNQIWYSADGGTFHPFGGALSPGTSFTAQAADFATLTALNDNPAAKFRIQLDGATSGTGNVRFDNVQFLGAELEHASVPEPSTTLLLGLAGGGAALRGYWVRRRRRAGSENHATSPPPGR